MHFKRGQGVIAAAYVCLVCWWGDALLSSVQIAVFFCQMLERVILGASRRWLCASWIANNKYLCVHGWWFSWFLFKSLFWSSNAIWKITGLKVYLTINVECIKKFMLYVGTYLLRLYIKNVEGQSSWTCI